MPEYKPRILPVRYFVYESGDWEADRDAEIVETTEAEFLAADGKIIYERHSVFANGVDQICLTKYPERT